IPDASQVSITSSTAGGVLDLNGFNETVAGVQSTGTATVQAATKVTLGSGTLTIGAPTGETFGGVISGAGGNIVKNGSGAWNLTNVNTYTGNTTINNGSVTIDGDATLGTSAGTLKLAGGNLVITADRGASTNPVAQAISVSADSAITTSSTASSVVVN